MTEGRDPELVLEAPAGGEVGMREWAQDLMLAMQPVAELLDTVHKSTGRYADSLAKEAAKVTDSSLTPSAQVLAQLGEQNLTFAGWGRQQARQFKEEFLKASLSSAERARMVDLAESSLAAQTLEEQADSGTFEDYLGEYYRQYQQCCAKD